MPVAAVLAWSACALCLGCTPSTLLALSCVGAVVVVIGLLRRTAGAYVIATCAGCAVLVLLPLAARQHLDRTSTLAALARRSAVVQLDAVTAGDPGVLAAHGVAGVPRAAVAAKAAAVMLAGRRVGVSGRVLIIAPGVGWTGLVPGQRVRFDAQVVPARAAGPSGVVALARGRPMLLGRPPWWQWVAARMRQSLRDAAAGLPSGPRGLLPGLVDGDTTTLDPVIKAHFRVAGMTHLVAVSGTNCSILVGAVLAAMRRSRLRPWQRAAIAGLVVAGFVIVARPSPSVLRAAVMAVIALAALAGGRRRRGVTALGAAVVVLLVIDPLLARDVGFTMSVLATAALLTIAVPAAAALERRHVPAMIAGPVAVAAAAHLVTAPVVAAISGRVSLVAIPANVLAEPVVAATTVLGFVAALLAPVCLPVGGVAAQLAGWPCRWLILVADRFAGLPGATLPWTPGTSGGLVLAAVAFACLVLAVRFRWARRVLGAALLVALLVQVPVRAVLTAWPPANWFFVACDVGQGDGLVLRAGPGTAVVVDAGPDPVLMDRCLHDLGVQHVALLLFSHLHLDHVGGIDGVFRDRAVDQVATGPLDEPVSGLHIVDHALRQHALTLGLLRAGTELTIGELHLEVIAAAAYHGTRSDPNNSSAVLRATVHGVRVLLTGDVELEAQQAMLAQHLDVAADVLKVPHHGSAYSLPAFLAAVHASAAVISVGLHNDYGHPAASLLSTLHSLGVPYRRTDRDGDVAFAGAVSHMVAFARGKQP